ncbi:Uncharacterised protein [Mycobacterium tuberculosis]|nr:Uncharacterised protein [Mycobacterium tuberculosis]
MTPRHFLIAPAPPRRARSQDARPYDLSRIAWAHAFPDS